MLGNCKYEKPTSLSFRESRWEGMKHTTPHVIKSVVIQSGYCERWRIEEHSNVNGIVVKYRELNFIVVKDSSAQTTFLGFFETLKGIE